MRTLLIEAAQTNDPGGLNRQAASWRGIKPRTCRGDGRLVRLETSGLLKGGSAHSPSIPKLLLQTGGGYPPPPGDDRDEEKRQGEGPCPGARAFSSRRRTGRGSTP